LDKKAVVETQMDRNNECLALLYFGMSYVQVSCLSRARRRSIETYEQMKGKYLTLFFDPFNRTRLTPVEKP